MKDHYPLVIIGGGPAGLSAAIVAAEHGQQVAVLDDQAAPGGQIYRAIENIPEERIKELGSDYSRGRDLVKRFRSYGRSMTSSKSDCCTRVRHA